MNKVVDVSGMHHCLWTRGMCVSDTLCYRSTQTVRVDITIPWADEYSWHISDRFSPLPAVSNVPTDASGLLMASAATV